MRENEKLETPPNFSGWDAQQVKTYTEGYLEKYPWVGVAGHDVRESFLMLVSVICNPLQESSQFRIKQTLAEQNESLVSNLLQKLKVSVMLYNEISF